MELKHNNCRPSSLRMMPQALGKARIERPPRHCQWPNGNWHSQPAADSPGMGIPLEKKLTPGKLWPDKGEESGRGERMGNLWAQFPWILQSLRPPENL